jgi:hypothetical protein
MKELIIRCSDFPKDYIQFNDKKIKTILLEKIFTELIRLYCISEDEYIRVQSTHLRTISNDYRTILEYMEENQVIHINNIYSAGSFTKSYLFTEHFKKMIIDLIVELQPRIIETKKIISNNFLKSSKNHVIDHYIQQRLFNDFISLKRFPSTNNYGYFVNCKSIDEFKKALINYYYDTQAAFNQKCFYKLDLENNRLYTSFCNIKKELRETKYYFTKGQKLLNKDIKSSHVFFMALLLLDDYRRGKLDKEEYYKFISLVIDPQNDIYTYFKTKYYPWMERSRIKTLFFILLFGDNDTKKKLLKLDKKDQDKDFKGHNIRINDNFWYEFSSLFNAIKERKWVDGRLDKSRLTKELNKLEANFLFNHVIKRLYQENKYIKIVTVHDQFYYDEEYEEKVNIIWEEELSKLYGRFDQITKTSYYQDCVVNPKEYMKDEFANVNLEVFGIKTVNKEDDEDFGIQLKDVFGDLIYPPEDADKETNDMFWD